jgi:signal peptidase II
VRNTGSAFGLFQGSSEIIKVLALGAVVVLALYYARAAARDWVLALALGLQVGGAAGNIIDRFRHGYVVDFIDVSRWPTFNVADSAITVGVGLLIFSLLFRDHHHVHAPPTTERGPLTASPED